MTTLVLSNAADTYISNAGGGANKNYSTKNRMYVGAFRYSFIYFALPIPAGATVLGATLRIHEGEARTGTFHIDAYRVTEKFSINKVTWNNKPDVDATFATQTITDPTVWQQWDIDVTQQVQAVVDGGAYYGFRISSSSDFNVGIVSAQATETQYRPQLIIEWSDAPDQPTTLSPGGGRAISIAKPVLRTNFHDALGDTTQRALQVQINGTNDFSAPAFDSGEVLTPIPQLDLAATAYAGLAEGGTAWWRVRVQDGTGLWSPWSESASFTRASKGTLTITTPANAPNNYVEDPSPPIGWTFTGRTQKDYEVLVKADTDADYMWTSGRVTSTDHAMSIPSGVLTLIDNQTYTLVVRVWDDVDREATLNDTQFVEVSKGFAYHYTATVTPATSLVMTNSYPLPVATLTWNRSTPPDEFSIMRDGEVIESNIPGAELFVGGTSYEYVDRAAGARVPHVWSVITHVNGQSSANSPTVTGIVKMDAPWIMDTDGSNPVCLFNPSADIAVSDDATAYFPVALGANPVLVTQGSLGVKTGTFSGRISEQGATNGLSAQEQADNFQNLLEKSGTRLRLYNINQVMDVVIYAGKSLPYSYPNGDVEYDVDFSFFEVKF